MRQHSCNHPEIDPNHSKYVCIYIYTISIQFLNMGVSENLTTPPLNGNFDWEHGAVNLGYPIFRQAHIDWRFLGFWLAISQLLEAERGNSGPFLDLGVFCEASPVGPGLLPSPSRA